MTIDERMASIRRAIDAQDATIARLACKSLHDRRAAKRNYLAITSAEMYRALKVCELAEVLTHA